MAPVDLDAVDQALAAPHVIDLRADGWTIMHPLSCRPNLFACPVNQAADRDLREWPGVLGRFEVEFDGDGLLMIGRPVEGDPRDPIDLPAMVAELRATREALAFVYERLAQDGYEPAGPMPARIREALAAKRRGEGG